MSRPGPKRGEAARQRRAHAEAVEALKDARVALAVLSMEAGDTKFRSEIFLGAMLRIEEALREANG